jgi:hypothetical protein
MLAKIFKNDPLIKALKGGSTKRRTKKRKTTTKLTSSEKRIVNAVSRRVKTPKRKRRY